MPYYEMLGDLSVNQWVVVAPLESLPRLNGNLGGAGAPVEMSVRMNGPRVDFSMPLCYPLVTRRLAEVIDRLAGKDIERIPVRIGDDCKGFELIRVLWEADCLDRKRSRISGDGMIWEMALDRRKVPKRQLFRLPSERRIIVTERIKNAIEESRFTGVKFDKTAESELDSGDRFRGHHT